METSPNYGFCPHKRAIVGLDAYYCPDCKRSFEQATPTYKALAATSTTKTDPTTHEIFKSWCELAAGEWGTPIPIKTIAANMKIGLFEIKELIEVLLASGRTDFELISSRKCDRNLKIGSRRVADLTFYQGSKSVHDCMERIRSLTAENERLTAALNASEHTIKRAKDINPVQRPSLLRVMRLVHDACMTLSRVSGGWLLKLGHMSRRFRNLYQIWDLLLADDWCLGDIFPPEPERPKPQYSPPRLHPRNPSIAPSVPQPIPL